MFVGLASGFSRICFVRRMTRCTERTGFGFLLRGNERCRLTGSLVYSCGVRECRFAIGCGRGGLSFFRGRMCSFRGSVLGCPVNG